MKIKQITEARLSKPKPQYKNLSAEKVVQMFFNEDIAQSKDYADTEMYDPEDHLHGTRHFYVKDGLVVLDDRFGESISNVILFPKGKGKEKWLTMNHETEREWWVNPAKFEIDMTTPVYRK